MPRQILPDSATLLALRRAGHTPKQIAHMYGVTEGAVYQALVAAGAVKQRPRHSDFIPWRVKREHLWAVPANMLRLLAREAGGEELPAEHPLVMEPAAGRAVLQAGNAAGMFMAAFAIPV